MDTLTKMEELVAKMRVEADKLYEKNVKASAPKLRKQCQELKGLCQISRAEALAHQKSIPVNGGRGRKAPAPVEEVEEEEEFDVDV